MRTWGFKKSADNQIAWSHRNRKNNKLYAVNLLPYFLLYWHDFWINQPVNVDFKELTLGTYINSCSEFLWKLLFAQEVKKLLTLGGAWRSVFVFKTAWNLQCQMSRSSAALNIHFNIFFPPTPVSSFQVSRQFCMHFSFLPCALHAQSYSSPRIH